MREVGYAETVAQHPKVVTEKPEYKAIMKTVAEQLEEERQRCISELTDPEVRKSASFRDRIEAINKLTNNIQLITGKPTENEHVTFTWEDEEEGK